MRKRLWLGLLWVSCFSIMTEAAKVEVNSKTGDDNTGTPYQTIEAAIDALRGDPMAEDNEILIMDIGPHYLSTTVKVDVQVKILAGVGVKPIIVAPPATATEIIEDPFLYVTVSEKNGNFAFQIFPPSYSTVEFNGLTFIPLREETLKQQPRQSAVLLGDVDYTGSQKIAGVKFSMRNCVITSNDGNDSPSPNTGIGVPLPTDTVFGGGGLELGASGYPGLDPQNNYQPLTGDKLEAYDVLVENCLITHCWVYGINISSEKVTVKDTDIMYNGMRGIQNIHFQNDGWQSILITGSPGHPAVLKGNGYIFAADGKNPGNAAFTTGTAIRMFGNQVIDFAWLDIVENFDNVPIDISSDNDTNGANIRSMDHVLIANNGGSALITSRSDGPTFSTGLAHIPLAISNCTFIGNKGAAPSTGQKNGSIFFYAGSAPVLFTNCILGGGKYTGIVLGAGDTTGGASAPDLPSDIKQAGITVSNCAFIGEGFYKLGSQSAAGKGRKADEIKFSQIITADPQFASIIPTESNAYMVTNSAYQKAGPSGSFLSGARNVSTPVADWSLF